jgi:hypothetical protein
MTSTDAIDGIWAGGGRDAETWIQYGTGVTLIEEVPAWDQATTQSRAPGAPTDVASLGHAMLRDGSGTHGGVTEIDGQPAFVARATDPSHAEGPGSVVVEVAGSEDSIIGTTAEISMADLYAVASALIDAGKSVPTGENGGG